MAEIFLEEKTPTNEQIKVYKILSYRIFKAKI